MKNLKLRYLLAAAIVSLVTSTFTPAQDGSPQATLSTEPLTSDQIAVYRTVIADYLKDSNALLNVSSTTEPLDQSDPFFDRACVTNIDLERRKLRVRLSTKSICSSQVTHNWS